MSGKGGTAIDVGFDSGAKRNAKGPSKELVERLSKQPDRTKVKQRSERESVFQEAGKDVASGTRAIMKVNPVTGKMTAVKKTGGQDMVREGSMYIPKEYLYAAAEAGLGSGNGMYSHLSALKRELGSNNNGAGPRHGPSKPTKTFNPAVNNVGGRIHKLDTVSKPSGSNIKQVVQGRSRSITNGSNNQVNESSYLRQKGVINGMSGCSNTRTVPKERKTGIASLGSCGGRSFIKHEKPDPKTAAKLSKNPLPESHTIERAPPIIKKLGGSSTKASGSSSGTNMSDREKRAAYFASKFSKT